MQSRFIFPNVSFFGLPSGTTTLQVRKGETFRIELTDDMGEELPVHELRWLASNDPVLDIRVETGSNEAGLKALESGFSEIQVQDNDNHIAKVFHITVFDPVEATTLNPVAGMPELKD